MTDELDDGGSFAGIHPGSWDTSFALTGTAAATLTGLFFIAFSLRVQDLQLSRVIRTRARYLLLWLVVIAISSAFVVMPGQPRARLPRRQRMAPRSALTPPARRRAERKKGLDLARSEEFELPAR